MQFVHDVNGGWWLRLTTDEDVDRYLNITKKEISLNDDTDLLLSKIGLSTKKIDVISLCVNSFPSLRTEFETVLRKNITENGEVFVNKVGGKTFSLEYNQSEWREDLVFPTDE